MSTKIKRERSQKINLKCGICLATLSSCIKSNYNGKIQRCFFKVCCSALKIDSHLFKVDPTSLDSRKKQQTIRFCDNCLLTLKELNKLTRKLSLIQNYIRNIEVKLKSQILNYQKQDTADSDDHNNNNEANKRYTADRKRFSHLAVQDFLPVIQLPRINSQDSTLRKYILPKKRIINQTKIEIDDESTIDIKYEPLFHNTEELFLDGSDQLLLDTAASQDNRESGYFPVKEILEPESFQPKCDTNTIPDEIPIIAPSEYKISDSEGLSIFHQDQREAKTESKLEPSTEEFNEDGDFGDVGIECSDSSDSDYKPENSFKIVKQTTKSYGKKSVTSRGKPRCPATRTAETETASDTKVGKEECETKVGSKRRRNRNYLDGVEFKVTEGKYSYRTIEYCYDEATCLYKCCACQKTRKSQSKMRGHIASVHGVEGFGKWDYCGVPYRLNKESGKLECSLCKKEFLSRDSVGLHIRANHKEKCTKLKKNVYYEDKIKKGKHKGENFRTRLLETTPIMLEEGKWLYREVHITKHSDGTFHCGACERIRKSWHSILLHVAECHDDKAKSENECQICGMQFGTPYRLKTHMEKHTTIKAHQCEHCGECFQYKCSLYAHVARIHEKRRPFVCEYCAKSFFTRKDCRVHVRTHTKEKPFVCLFSGCGLSFAFHATLKNHMNSKVHCHTTVT